MHYRPKDWDKIQRDKCYDGDVVYREIDTFEAGADAMYEPAYDKGKEDGKKELLEALRKGGACYKKVGEARFFASKEITQNGCLVFIPEEDMV